jgi:hypothetical protein
MKLVWKLLRRHISVAQLAGFFLANLCGMVIVLLSVQFYNDVSPVFTEGDSFMKKDYIIVSKKVSTLGSFVGKSRTFSANDMEEIKEQPFTKGVGAFTSSRFSVSAGVGMEQVGLQMSTAMFFESVPDEYVDVKLDKWHFNPEEQIIPIIIPRNYLNLYNFGFSMSRAGLPQLSEDFLKDLPIQITIRANNGSVINYESYIVGYSDRINTILVPDDFLKWANEQYGYATSAFNTDTQQGSSRLIFETNDPSDTARCCRSGVE